MNIKSIQKQIQKRRDRRVKKVRRTILESLSQPRFTVYRSGNHMYAQIIDDIKRITIASSNDLKIKGKNMENAIIVGREIAQKAIAKKVKKVIFDRGWYKFHGRVKAVADSAREAGLEF
ncbi:MAG: 50S ribosomal protein L18 [Candidatus Roizmanbacteria bacterium]|nr:50S ribosomal protein L18 [Candidatus Roizmanbacteria bacterium]